MDYQGRALLYCYMLPQSCLELVLLEMTQNTI